MITIHGVQPKTKRPCWRYTQWGTRVF